MAQIDVSELMNDPDFVNSFIVVRRTASINDLGRNVVKETKLKAIGSVQAADGETLLSLPEASRMINTQNIFTKTLLIADVEGGYSDIIIWQGRRYQTLKVTPWDNFGAGWYKCVCQLEKASL